MRLSIFASVLPIIFFTFVHPLAHLVLKLRNSDTYLTYLSMARPLFTILLLSLFFSPVLAQLPCGTGDVSLEQERITQQLILQVKKQMAGKARVASGGITYIAVKPHFIRTDAGVTNLTMQAFNNAIAICNSYFLNAGIQFYICGTPGSATNPAPHYIDRSDAYNWTITNAQRDDMSNTNNVNNAHNIYFSGTIGGLAGFSFGPTQNRVNNRTFMHNDYANNNRTLAHELGHYFNLPHTFNNSDALDGNGQPDLTKRELVTRNSAETLPRLSANCTTAGDYVCDTPSDPHNLPGGDVTNCSPTGVGITARDANNDLFVPMPNNLMGYYYCPPYQFTPGQSDRVNTALSINNVPGSNPATSYSLNCPETTQTAPSNLTLTLISSGVAVGATLSWTDNSLVETGYIIERSTSAASGFLAIGGVDANMTSFVDRQTQPGVTYYYRVKPSNSKENYSTTSQALQTPAFCGALYSSPCTENRRTIDNFQIRLAGTTLLSNNNSGCSTNSYGDFTGLATATVTAGTTYTFVMNTGYLNGYNPQHIGIWIDANNNNSFTDAGEQVFQSTGDVMNGTTQITGQFTVPSSATSGVVRLRIRSRDESSGVVEDPCVDYGNGEAEDYSLYVLPSFRITTTIAAVCPEQATFPVAFVTTATPDPGNQYTVELSNQAGSFATPTVVGSGTASPISVTLPGATTPGGGYALRVVGSAPSLTSAASSTFVFSGTIALAMSNLTTCEGFPINLSATATAIGQTFSYTFTGPNGVVSGTGNTRTAASMSQGSYSFSVAVANQYGCRQSASNTVTVDPALNPSLTPGPSGTLTCAQTALTLTASGGTSYTFAGASGTLGTPGSVSTVEVNSPGTYSVAIANASGCQTTLITAISSNTTAPTVSINPGSATLTCAVTAITLTANSTATTRLWFDNSTGSTLVVSASGTYGLSVTGSNGCSATATNVSIAQNLSDKLALAASTTTLSCNTPTALLTAAPGSGTYVFSGPGLNQRGSGNTATASVAGVYNVTAAITAVCFTTAVVTVIGVPGTAPSAQVYGSGNLSCQMPTLSLTALGGSGYQFNGPSGGIVSQTDGRERIIIGTYLLNGTPIPTVGLAVVRKPGTYTVVVTNADGCSSTATIIVTGTECLSGTPNAVSGQGQ